MNHVNPPCPRACCTHLLLVSGVEKEKVLGSIYFPVLVYQVLYLLICHGNTFVVLCWICGISDLMEMFIIQFHIQTISPCFVLIIEHSVNKSFLLYWSIVIVNYFFTLQIWLSHRSKIKYKESAANCTEYTGPSGHKIHFFMQDHCKLKTF